MITDPRKDMIDSILTPKGYNVFRNGDVDPDIPVVFTRDVLVDNSRKIRAGTIAYLHHAHVESAKIKKDGSITFMITFYIIDTRNKIGYISSMGHGFDPITLKCIANADGTVTLANNKTLLTDVIEHATETTASTLNKFRSAADEYLCTTDRYRENRELLGCIALGSFVILLFVAMGFILYDMILIGVLCICLIAAICGGIGLYTEKRLSDNKLDKAFSDKFHQLHADVTAIETAYADKFVLAANAADGV